MANEDKKATPAPTITAARLGEIAIEMADEKNSNFIWPINKANLRGRWSRVNTLGQTMAQVMQAMPDIPGQRVGVDTGRRTAYIRDPLNEERNADLLRKIAKVWKEAYRTEGGPEKDTLKEGLTDTEIKSWLFWMRRLVDNGQAVCVLGDLPSMEVIEKLPGKTMIENYNSSSRTVKFLEDARRLEELRQQRFEETLGEV